MSSSTENQALSAILFLYREVLQLDLPWVGAFNRSKVPKRLPVVLTQAEVKAVRLRVKDVELHRHELIVRSGKGDKDRVTVLPVSLSTALAEQLQRRPSIQLKLEVARCAATMWRKSRWSAIANARRKRWALLSW